MIERSQLELTPSPGTPAPASGECGDINGLRQHLLDAEMAIIDLNRQMTEARLSNQTTGGLAIELLNTSRRVT